MIEKYCHVPAFDPIHGQNVWILGDGFEKTASIIKEAQVSPEIERAIGKFTKQAGHRYVLVNGIGAGEFWSSNKNGDFFPESGLEHRGEDYGYETFLSGHNFVHHNNKDPKFAVGQIKVSHYNKAMHRCEQVLETNLSLLAKVDPEIYEKVASGQPVDVSMGSKCDFDVCTYCSNRAPTRNEYCQHLKEAMNQILPNGQKICAYTPHPRFFDMSFVKRGADVTAKALMYLDKQASDETAIEHLGEIRTCPDPLVHEAAECERPIREPEFQDDARATALLLEATEPRIPQETLRAMGKVGFVQTLSTASHLGIVLKPEEFQYLALCEMGKTEIAEKCAAAGAVVDISESGSWFDPSIKTIAAQTDPENWSHEVGHLLAPFVSHRSAFAPFVEKRANAAFMMPDALIVKCAAASDVKVASFMTPELAAAVGLGYIIYRKGLPEADIDKVKKALSDPNTSKRLIPVLIALVAGGSVIDRMMSFEPPTTLLGPDEPKTAGVTSEVLGPVGATYLYSAYAKHKAEQGKPINGLEHAAMDYPLPISLASIAGVAALKRRMKGTMPKKAAMISSVAVDASKKEMSKESTMVGDAALALGSGMYHPADTLGMLADMAIPAGIAGAVSLSKKIVSGKEKPHKNR